MCHFLNPSEQCHCFVLQSPSLADFCRYVILCCQVGSADQIIFSHGVNMIDGADA